MQSAQVLDKGSICMVDIMGNDFRVLEAARISTGSKAIKGKEKDVELINYLMENEHHTPFEKIVFEFHIKCPIFVARQWFRHRIGSFNEVSGRYKEIPWEVYKPNKWRYQSSKNKQGSEGFIEDPVTSSNAEDLLNNSYEVAQQAYEELLRQGISRELARLVMPVGIYTEFFWTVNFRSLMNFLKLRMDSHAQLEIRQYANTIYDLLEISGGLPWTLEAFRKHILNNNGNNK
jgi:thymidylate synthase (FAD)